MTVCSFASYVYCISSLQILCLSNYMKLIVLLVVIITGRWSYILEQVSLPSWTEQILSKTKDIQARICYLSLCWHSVVPGKIPVHVLFFEIRVMYTRSFLSFRWFQSVSWSVCQSVAWPSKHQMAILFVFSQTISLPTISKPSIQPLRQSVWLAGCPSSIFPSFSHVVGLFNVILYVLFWRAVIEVNCQYHSEFGHHFFFCRLITGTYIYTVQMF